MISGQKQGLLLVAPHYESQRKHSADVSQLPAPLSGMLATSKSGTHWEPRDQGLDGGLVSSLRALL